MTIAACPKCREQVSLPADVASEDTVQCPLCSERYSFADVLAELPPALLVVSKGLPDDLSALEGLSLSEDIPQSAGDPRTTVAAFEFQTSPPPSVRGKRRPRIETATREVRRQRSALREVIKVVLGGVVGLSIGQLILWWGMQRDPLSLGPRLSQVAPWAVPELFQGNVAATQDLPTRQRRANSSVRSELGSIASGAGATDVESIQPTITETAAREVLGTRAVEPEMSEAISEPSALSTGAAADVTTDEQPPGATLTSTRNPPAGASDAESLTLEASEAPTNGLTTQADEAASHQTPVAVPNVVDDSDEPADVAVESAGAAAEAEQSDRGEEASRDAGDAVEFSTQLRDPSDATLAEASLPPEPVRDPTHEAAARPIAVRPAPLKVVNASSYSMADLASRLDQAREASSAWSDPDAGEIRRRAANFYRSFAGLGEVLTGVDSLEFETSELSDQLHELMESLVRDETCITLTERVAPQWLARATTNRGVLVVGRVESIHKLAGGYEATLQVSPGETVVLIASGEPEVGFREGIKTCVLGLLINDPQQNIVGYDGSASQVIFDAYHEVVDR